MTVETVELAPGYRLPRFVRGTWQLAGGHGPVDLARAITDMATFAEKQIGAIDLSFADADVEEMVGQFRDFYRIDNGEAALAKLQVHSRFAPDLAVPASTTRAGIRAWVDQSLQRLRADRLDFVQLHWPDYAAPRWLETFAALADVKAEGKIGLVGACNLDSMHVAKLCDSDAKPAAIGVQYSLVDPRPEHGLTGVAFRAGFKLICYGALAGGFLSKRWLGTPAPTDLSFSPSLTRYKLIIDDFGGWELLQTLLGALNGIAYKHGASIANVALRWVLDRPHVAACVVGARYANHLEENLHVFDFKLDDADRAAIAAVLDQRRGPSGDVFMLERNPDSRHGRLMRASEQRP